MNAWNSSASPHKKNYMTCGASCVVKWFIFWIKGCQLLCFSMKEHAHCMSFKLTLFPSQPTPHFGRGIDYVPLAQNIIVGLVVRKPGVKGRNDSWGQLCRTKTLFSSILYKTWMFWFNGALCLFILFMVFVIWCSVKGFSNSVSDTVYKLCNTSSEFS